MLDLEKSIMYTKLLRDRNYGNGVDGKWTRNAYRAKQRDSGEDWGMFRASGDAETVEDVQKRVSRFLSGYLFSVYDGAEVLVVSHSLFISLALKSINDMAPIEGIEHVKQPFNAMNGRIMDLACTSLTIDLQRGRPDQAKATTWDKSDYDQDQSTIRQFTRSSMSPNDKITNTMVKNRSIDIDGTEAPGLYKK